MDKKINENLVRLTEGQTAQVAGGVTVISPVAGCRTCTSGRPVLFQNEVASLAT